MAPLSSIALGQMEEGFCKFFVEFSAKNFAIVSASACVFTFSLVFIGCSCCQRRRKKGKEGSKKSKKDAEAMDVGIELKTSVKSASSDQQKLTRESEKAPSKTSSTSTRAEPKAPSARTPSQRDTPKKSSVGMPPPQPPPPPPPPPPPLPMQVAASRQGRVSPKSKTKGTTSIVAKAGRKNEDVVKMSTVSKIQGHGGKVVSKGMSHSKPQLDYVDTDNPAYQSLAELDDVFNASKAQPQQQQQQQQQNVSASAAVSDEKSKSVQQRAAKARSKAKN